MSSFIGGAFRVRIDDFYERATPLIQDCAEAILVLNRYPISNSVVRLTLQRNFDVLRYSKSILELLQ